MEIEKQNDKWVHSVCNTETKPQQTTIPKSIFTPYKDASTDKIEDAHKKSQAIWHLCFADASNIVKPDIKSLNGFEKDINGKDRMILAQVFYKGIVELLK